jgi:lysophospholipase L1-like esterase
MKSAVQKNNSLLMHGGIVAGVLVFSVLLYLTLSAGKNFNQPNAVLAATTDGVGVISDSDADEYRGDDNRGGAYAATTLNWVELLATKRNLNLGTWGNWGDARRTGYKYNWSRSGATARDMITLGEHTGLAQQVASGEVKYALISIGGNDFHSWNGTYGPIYDGTLTGAALQAKIDGIVQDITTAVDTLQSAGPVKIAVANISDKGSTVAFMMQYPDATKRQRVTNAIQSVNSGIATMAASKNVTLVDMYGWGTSLLGQVDAQGFLHVGGELIDLKVKGDEPHHLQLGDSVGHAGTVANGLIANYLFINPMNAAYQLGVEPFTESEILVNAGIIPSTSATPAPSATLIATASPTPSVAPTVIPTRSPSPTPVPTATATPVPVSQTVIPSTYVVNTGTFQSGSLTSLNADDNNFLNIRSTTSGSTRTTSSDFAVLSVPVSAPKTIKVELRAKSSTSSTTITTSVYNFSTASWQQVNSYTGNTAETTKTVSLTSNVARYIDSATNRMGIRVTSSRGGSTTHTMSFEKLAITFSK